MKANVTHCLGISLLLWFLSLDTAFAQGNNAWSWGVRTGLWSDSYASSITADKLGNCFTIATFGTPASLQDLGNSGASITKFGPSGNIIWDDTIRGSHYERLKGVAVDSLGNSLIVGYHDETLVIGDTVLTSGFCFLAKYDTIGNLMWVRNIGADTSFIYASAIALDVSGNIYLTGNFNGTITLGNTTHTSNGSVDILLVKMDVDGNYLWSKAAGGSYTDYSNAIAIDHSGNCFLSGSFAGTFLIDSLTLVDSILSRNIFLVKYDPAGNLLWGRQAGSTGWDQANGIAIDQSGNCYQTGIFKDTVQFDGFSVIGNDYYNAFIAKYDAAGNVLWAKGATSAGSTFKMTYGTGIAVDANENCYVTGVFNDTAYFDNEVLPCSGNQDLFVVKYDANGNCLWAERGGGNYEASANAIALDPVGNCFVTGNFSGTIPFGNSQITPLYGDVDIFTAKVSTNVLETPETASSASPLQIWPNPFHTAITLQLPNASTAPVDLTLCNPQGQLVWKGRAAGTNTANSTFMPNPELPAGIYFLQATQNGHSFQTSLVKE